MDGKPNPKIYIVLLVFTAGLAGTTSGAEGLIDSSITITTDANSDNPLLTAESVQVKVNRDKDQRAVFICDGAQWLNQTGEPQIPWKVMTVLLPPNVNLSSVSGFMEPDFEPVSETWVVKPTPPPVTWNGDKTVVLWPKDKNIDENGRDTDIYVQDAFWPKENLRVLGTGRLRKWRLAQIAIPLAKYNPISGELLILRGSEVVITFERTAQEGPVSTEAELTDRIGESSVRRMAVNFEQGCIAYETTGGVGILDQNEPNTCYAIITTSAIESASSKLADFAEHKQSLGFDVKVITEANFGGGSGDAAAENIRAWLQSHYVTDNIEYVLLIGNPHPVDGDIPMKTLLPDPNFEKYPSDLYYAELTGNWDLDGDANYGEWAGDFGPGGIDTFFEVTVGRIPYYGSTNDLDAILEKIINYESQTEPPAWRNNVLLPMEPITQSDFSYPLGEAIKDDILIPNEWSYHRIYEEDYNLVPPPDTIPCNIDNVTDVWNGDANNSDGMYGLVVWFTHGSATLALDVMDTSHVPELNDEYPSFTFQTSCNNSYPETTNNLSFEILKNGGICTIGATRTSWGGSESPIAGTTGNTGMAYEYTRRLVKGFKCGAALNDLKQVIAPSSTSCWENFITFNIYGDPALGLVLPSSVPPNILYVDSRAGSGGDGHSWETAYKDLQDAIDEASLHASEVNEIRVATGTYTPDRGTGDREAAFGLINGVAIKGGYAGIGAVDPNARDIDLYETILSGDLAGNDGPGDWENNEENSFHVLTSESAIETAIIDGFIVTAGHANGISVVRGTLGGGMYNWISSPTVMNCTFLKNRAKTGGGIYNYDDLSTPRIENCVFIGNYAYSSPTSGSGGGMANGHGSSPFVSDCVFVGNSAVDKGGGIYNFFYYGPNPTISNCLFIANSSGFGGGIYNERSDAVVTHSSFIGNSALYGGGIHNNDSDSEITNCIFAGHSSNKGAGIIVSSSNPVISNCTFANNSAQSGSGLYNSSSSTTLLTNCILWNTGSEIVNDGTITVTYSDVKGGWPVPPSFGNINVYPFFVDSDNDDPNLWDFHLLSSDGRWNSTFYNVELNNDEIINLIDFALIAEVWMKTGISDRDLDRSGVIDHGDIGIFAQYYLANSSEDGWLEDSSTSPCIDAGDPNSEFSSEPWPNGKRINMGAFGGTEQASKSGNIADFNVDGRVNFTDLAELGKLWATSQEAIEDLNGDGIVNIGDLAILAANWLWEK